jgi:hypothetical protein
MGLNSSSEFVTKLVSRYPDMPVLVIAYEFPAYLARHAGKILFLGAHFPENRLASKDFRFIKAETTEAVTIETQKLRRDPAGKDWQLVYIDHDHRLDNLVEHINAALGLAAGSAVFLFDDAVPPEIGMAGPEPTKSWWVGEVWMLKTLLRPERENSFCLAADLSPTGLLAASGFAPLDTAEIKPDYEALSAIKTDEALRATLDVSDPNKVFGAAAAALNTAVAPHAVILETGAEILAPASRRIIAELRPWHKQPPVFCLDLSANGRNLDRIRHGELVASAKYIDTFESCTLAGFNGLIKDWAYGDHWLDTGDQDLNVIATSGDSYGNQYTGMFLLDGRPALPNEVFTRAARIDESVMFGTPDEPDNWGMWLLLGLPSLHEFLDNRALYSKFLVSVQSPWQRKLLAAAGLSPGDLLEHNRAASYLCSRISMVRKSFRDMFVSDDEKMFFAKLGAYFAGASQGGRRIFISRLKRTENGGAYRGLLNERELIMALRQLDFEIIEPEDMSFEAQVAIFRGADIVVGLGGAGMFNTIFCKPGARVVTIESGVVFVNSHTNLFGSLGLDYGVILGEEDSSDPRPVQKRWTLNVPAAIKQITEFL